MEYGRWEIGAGCGDVYMRFKLVCSSDYKKEVAGLVDEFCPECDEKGVGQREPQKQAGAWQWKMQGGIVEDAVWRIICRNESVDDCFLTCCVAVG